MITINSLSLLSENTLTSFYIKQCYREKWVICFDVFVSADCHRVVWTVGCLRGTLGLYDRSMC